MKPCYKCGVCGETMGYTSFWSWLITPHLGTKRYIKCKHCGAPEHFMKPTNKWETLQFELNILFGILMSICAIISFSQNWVLFGHIDILCAVLNFIDAHLMWCRKGGNDDV